MRHKIGIFLGYKGDVVAVLDVELLAVSYGVSLFVKLGDYSHLVVLAHGAFCESANEFCSVKISALNIGIIRVGSSEIQQLLILCLAQG